jgi:hypothetical protein
VLGRYGDAGATKELVDQREKLQDMLAAMGFTDNGRDKMRWFYLCDLF